jgi:hypothetical protein
MRFVALLLALFAGLTHARDDSGCTPDIEEALRSINPKVEIEGLAVSPHCKPWPPSAGKIVAAVMAFEQGGERDRKWLGVLALLDARSRRILQSHRFQVDEDATSSVDDNSLRLDTAPYILAPRVRALGLRYSSGKVGASAATSKREDQLTLFVPDGRQLREVLSLPMRSYEAVKGCLGSCPDAVWDEATLTIAVGPAGPQGYNDLLVTAAVVRDGNAPSASFDLKPRRESLAYRYDGLVYRRQGPARWWESY